jgi:hypothetical protein
VGIVKNQAMNFNEIAMNEQIKVVGGDANNSDGGLYES